MKHLLIFYCLLLSFIGLGQDVQVHRTIGSVQNDINSCKKCVVVTYKVTVSGPQQPITIEEDLNTNGCMSDCVDRVHAIGSYPALVLGNTPQLTSTGYKITTNQIPSGSHDFTFQVKVCTNMDGSKDQCKYEFGNSVSVTCSSTTDISSTTVGDPKKDVSSTRNNWKSKIDCIEQTGYNCYRYTVEFGSDCFGNDLSGNPQLFSFNVPTGGEINNITPLNFNHNSTLNSSTPYGSREVFFSFDNGQPTTFDVDKTYRFAVDVKYPCDDFPLGSNVQVNFGHPVSIWFRGGGFFGQTGYQRPPSCPSINPCRPSLFRPCPGEFIQSSTDSHMLDLESNAYITLQTTLGNAFQSPGCNNNLRLQYVNDGNTTMTNLDYYVDIPSDIELVKGCGSSTHYQLNNSGNWVQGNYDQLPVNQISQVTAVRWVEPSSRIAPIKICGGEDNRSSVKKNLCFRYRQTSQIGNQVEFCASGTYEATTDCFGDNCDVNDIPQPTNLPVKKCIEKEILSPRPKSRIYKSVSPSLVYPGDPIEFTIKVTNTGSAGVTSVLTDHIPSVIVNPSITTIQYDDGSGWQNGHNGWATAQNLTGNTINMNLDLPGTCVTSGCCKERVNSLQFKIRGFVEDCTDAGKFINTAQATNIGSARAGFVVRNRNQLFMQKKAKGDASTVMTTNTTEVGQGGLIDYRIVIKNEDPQNWYDPLFIDVLSKKNAKRLCSTSSLQGSNFDVELASNVSVDYSGATNLTPANTSWMKVNNVNPIRTGANYGHPLLCGFTNVFGNNATGATNIATPTNSKHGFSAQFKGFLNCQDSIVIRFKGKVMNGRAGDKAVNSAYLASKTKPSESYNTFGRSDVAAEIVDWELPCCEESFGDVKYIGMDRWRSSQNLLLPWFYLRTNSQIPIQKVRASIVDFELIYPRGAQECYRCHSDNKELGTINLSKTSHGLGNLHRQSPDPSVKFPREVIWDLGQPSQLNNRSYFRLGVNIPDGLNLECCKAEVKLCVKFEVTDVNCNTCEYIQCFKLGVPKGFRFTDRELDRGVSTKLKRELIDLNHFQGSEKIDLEQLLENDEFLEKIDSEILPERMIQDHEKQGCSTCKKK